jgi:DNA-binding NtrC family response regulator
MNNPVWIIDDDKAIRWVLEKALGRSGIGFDSFSSADDALNALYDKRRASSFPTSACRYRWPEIPVRVKADHPQLPVIIMTAHSDLDSAVAAFQGGAFEYLPKPFDVDQAVQLIERALGSNSQIEATGVEAMPVLLGQARPCRMCSAPLAAVAIPRHRADYRRIRYRQGGWPKRCTAIRCVPASPSLPEHRRHSQGFAGVRTVRP